jgi:methyl-accepting chemotaxis protein
MQQTAIALSGKEIDPSAREAAQAMVSGEEGYRPFRLHNEDFYVFYKPFKRKAVPGRSTEELGWSAGIVYPEDDIFGDYNSLMYYVLIIAAVGLLLMFVLSRLVIHRQLMPLNMLTREAHRIANGQYDVQIPMSKRGDEVGRLQENFRQMQQTLSTNIGEMEQLKVKLQEHGEELKIAYKRAQKADRMKTAFLHNMTNQMLAPADTIDRDVSALCNRSKDRQESGQLAESIMQNGATIADLLKNLINISDEEGVKYDWRT